MNRKLRFVLYASILLNAMAAIYFIPKFISKISPKESLIVQDDYWMQRDKYFDLLPVDSTSIVLLGTSLTHNFEIQETSAAPIKNRGINGDNISGMRNRLNAMSKGTPRKIIIEAGINDIADLKLENLAIVKQYQSLIENIKKDTPSTTILMTSVFPVANESAQMPGYCSPETNTQINDLNKRLSSMADSMHVTFLNFHSDFLKNGELNPKFSMDGVHFSANGYLKWHELLKSHLD